MPKMNFDAPFEQRAWPLRLFYHSIRSILMGLMIVVCGVRAYGRNRIPEKGMALLMANHSSYFDVVLLGISQKRNVDFMARSGLFIPILGGMIRCLGGFPIQRGGGGASGIKETLKRLRQQAMVGMFPEGTRTRDGAIQPIKPGVANIARRSGATIVCAGIAGTFEAWPRHRSIPGSYPIHVVFANPIVTENFLDLSEDQAVELLQSRLTDAFGEAKSAEIHMRDIMMF